MNKAGMKTPRAAFGKLLLNESRLAWRVPIGLGAGLGLPILLLVILGLIPGTREPSSDLGGLSYFALLYPILVAVTILAQGINVLPRSLIKYRETGILRRLSVTPVPPSWLLAAQIVINVAIAVVGIILVTAVGVVAFGLALPKNLPGFLLADLLTITSLLAVGFASRRSLEMTHWRRELAHFCSLRCYFSAAYGFRVRLCRLFWSISAT